MNILILGSGAREHAIAYSLNKSKQDVKIFVAPGNVGTSQIAQNIFINICNNNAIKYCVKEYNIQMLIVGPETPLVNGVVDFCKNDAELSELLIIGPNKKGAELEGSKDFAKQFMQKYNIPTAAYKTFTKENIFEGYKFLSTIKAPYVLKADGLAAGKGVLILDKLEEAKQNLKFMLYGQFGDASKKVLIEEYLEGIELSVFILTDGENYILLPQAKDYKRIGENNMGLNTGGMGASSPVPFADKDFMQKIEDKIIKPTINGIKAEGIDYCGFIFFGLIKVDNEPFVIEYNVRMGDPESEVVFPRIESDLLDIFEKTAKKQLQEVELKISDKTCSTVFLVSKGYPRTYEKRKIISNLDKVKDSIIFHAGTKIEDNKILTDGGRVLTVSSLGNDKNEALKISYKNAELINFENKYYRKDIGFDV